MRFDSGQHCELPPAPVILPRKHESFLVDHQSTDYESHTPTWLDE